MGSIYAREILGRKIPTVGLMSIGTEAGKGNEFTKECYQALRHAPRQLLPATSRATAFFRDPMDVVVCDGFIGNILLGRPLRAWPSPSPRVKGDITASRLSGMAGRLALLGRL